MSTQRSITSFFNVSRYAQPFAEDTVDNTLSQVPCRKSPESSQVDEKEVIPSIEKPVTISKKELGSKLKVSPKKRLRLSKNSVTNNSDSMPLAEQSLNSIGTKPTLVMIRERKEARKGARIETRKEAIKGNRQGFWTEDECDRFDTAFKKYGRDWNKVWVEVETRSK